MKKVRVKVMPGTKWLYFEYFTTKYQNRFARMQFDKGFEVQVCDGDLDPWIDFKERLHAKN